MADIDQLRARLREGWVIPACPLTLNAKRRFDERRQRALFRYYQAAGAGGLAVGVHTTQFAIHDPKVGLFEPILAVAAEEKKKTRSPITLVAGICGKTKQALAEASLAVQHGYDAGLLSLAAHAQATETELLSHCQTVGEAIPLIGFYLQPLAGGRVLSYAFWRRFAEIEAVVAIKIAPFNRYQTLDVVRAVVDAGRETLLSIPATMTTSCWIC